MQTSHYSFDQLPFSDLFKTYVQNFDQLSDFYRINPFDESAIASEIEQFEFSGDRDRSVEILSSFNAQFDVNQVVFDNLEKLKQDDALAIVTGQQLGIYGGPLYTMFKTVATIHHARMLSEKYDRPVIPVFWLADEDHDYGEIRSLQIFGDENEVKNFEIPPAPSHNAPVAEMGIPNEIEVLCEELKGSLYDTEFSDDLWKLLERCFAPGKPFLEAFGQLMSRLFSPHGLVLAGSNISAFKEQTKDYIKYSVKQAAQIREQLELQTYKISEQYHQQVKLYDSNLFYLDDSAGRLKIKRGDDGWHAGNDYRWSTDELLQAIDNDPQKFSPNVFLRPILQDLLLPTLGYVAGPGELSYYGQMRKMYPSFNLEMPIIFPRLSATFIEPAINRIIHELSFDFHEYCQRIEDLEAAYVERSDTVDIEVIFDNWKQQVEQMAEPKKEKIVEVDSTLEGAVGKANATYFSELDKLKGKVYRAVKQQDETQLKRIRRIKTNLFPERNMQERVIAGIFYMNKYGLDMWDELLDELEAQEKFEDHTLIYL